MTAASNDTVSATRRYLSEAAVGLDDLPVGEREELLSDIADAVAELEDGSQVDGDYDLLVARLGRPQDFADEIRVSSGASRQLASSGVPSEPQGPSTIGRAVAAVATALRWTGSELEQVWWVVRAGLIAAALSIVLGMTISGLVGITCVLVFVSVVAGSVSHSKSGTKRRSPGHNLARGVGMVVGVPIVVMVTMIVVDSRAYLGASDSGPYPSGLAGELVSSHGRVENIYAFTPDGKRISDIRLYDQQGRPLNVGSIANLDEDPWRVTHPDLNDDSTFNVFPIRYAEASGRIANPDAGWPTGPGILSPGRPQGNVMDPEPGAEALINAPSVPAPVEQLGSEG